MKQREVVVTQSAADDLSAAVRYIAKTVQNAQAAANLLDEFDALTQRLKDNAQGYPFVRDEVARAAGYRWAGFGNYMAFFRVEDSNKRVVIDRIAYNKRNWVQLRVE